MTEPDPTLERPLYFPRGKGLGGSSSINGMLYVRGHPLDYDRWRDAGLPGWGFADVLPYFRRMEDCEDGASEWHGANGPLHVGWGKSERPIWPAMIEAGRQAGYPVTDDFNGACQEGFGYYQLNIREGRRAGTLASYLRPAFGRANLETLTNAHVMRVVVNEGRACGIEYRKGGGPVRRAHAECEVILSAGALQSPQLLMLSGIGPGADLAAHGIDLVADSPGVGRNYHDHADAAVACACPDPITVYGLTKGYRRNLIGLRYLLFGTGLGRYCQLEAGAFLKTRGDLPQPDIQFQGINTVMTIHKELLAQDAFSLDVVLLQPRSRGFVCLKSANPFDAPMIHPNLLSDEHDMATLRSGLKIARTVSRQPALARFRTHEIQPGPDVQTDEEFDAFIKANANTVMHGVGTCRMGADDDPGAVVDSQLRVRGVRCMRVVDASVMPSIVSGNTNAATIMIAEKAADLILGRSALALGNAEY